MTSAVVVGVVGVFFAGLLAGEEFVIRYGVRGPLARLDDLPHILFRQALIRPLRVLVPVLYLVTLTTAALATGLSGLDPGLPLRCCGIAVLLVWITLTARGTVPINAAVLAWDATAPPDNWRVEVDRWELLNTIRTWAAISAFSFLLCGLVLSAARR